MKRIFKTVFSLIILSASAGRVNAVPMESRRFTPYFNMNLSQGGYLPTSGDFFTGANVNMNVGLLSKINENHQIFGLYSLGFAGEGFRFPDTQEFASKNLLHNFNAEYRWQINPAFRLRPGMAYGINYSRTAAGEIWGEGLYDSKSLGGQLAADYIFGMFGKNTTLSAQWLYRDIKFPNYTDILREFQGTDSNTELAGGLKDQTLNEISLSLYWSKFFGRARYNIINFKRDEVVGSNGLYNGDKQRDTNMVLSGGFEGSLWIFETSPEVSYALHHSNQNFLLFQSATDPSPKFAADYYNYSEAHLALPFFVNFTKKWALNLGLDYQFRSYSSRQPRDSYNQFTDGTQKNNMVSLTAGFRKKLNEVSAMTLTFTSVVATSNNHFERYLPYNYTGQSVSLGYQLTY